jgi:hypothetical protein
VTKWASGIPTVFQKPLAKAANRLILGLVEVPAAALAAKAKDINHEQVIRERVRDALAKEATAQISGNIEVGERALDYFVADLFRKQENREEVLRHAVEELAQSPDSMTGQPAAAQSLDDDWLNDFGRHAENVSTERMRNLFGRILAGEIRRPGSYSMFTMDLLAKIGNNEATAIVSIAPYIIENFFILTPRSQSVLTFELSSKLGALGIFTSTSIGSVSANYKFTTGIPNIIPGKYSAMLPSVSGRPLAFIATSEPKSISFPCSILTQVGKEVLSLHACDLEPVMLSEFASHLSSQDAELYLGDIASGSGVGQMALRRVVPPVTP